MSEVQFSKQFLTLLDNKPQKYPSDYIFNPETFQLRIPYTLPKLSHPQHPACPNPSPTSATQAAAPGSVPSQSTLSLTLKSTRNPSFTIHLPSLPTSTPITTLKTQIYTHLSTKNPTLALDKIKILYNKKPIPASKATVYDVLGASPEGNAVEFGVMVMGGAADSDPNEITVNLGGEGAESRDGVEKEKVESVPVQPGEKSGVEVLKTPAFWDDLQGFLEQRLKDTAEAERVRGVFERALR